MVAGLPDAIGPDLADDRGVELADRLVQDRRDGGSVDQIRQLLCRARVDALDGIADAFPRSVDEVLRHRVRQNDIAIAVERFLLFERQRVGQVFLLSSFKPLARWVLSVATPEEFLRSRRLRR